MRLISVSVAKTSSDAALRVTQDFAGKPATFILFRTLVSSQAKPSTCDGQRLAIALTTLDFQRTENATKLMVTVQVVSFVGPDMIHEYESGNKSADHDPRC